MGEQLQPDGESREAEPRVLQPSSREPDHKSIHPQREPAGSGGILPPV